MLIDLSFLIPERSRKAGVVTFKLSAKYLWGFPPRAVGSRLPPLESGLCDGLTQRSATTSVSRPADTGSLHMALGMPALQTQAPCCEEVQATWRCSSREAPWRSQPAARSSARHVSGEDFERVPAIATSLLQPHES